RGGDGRRRGQGGRRPPEPAPGAGRRRSVRRGRLRGNAGRLIVIKVGVFGAGGRMGSMVCRTVADDPDLELVAAIDPHHAGFEVREVTGADVPGVQIMPTAEGLADAGAEVAVDFTEASAARENLR